MRASVVDGDGDATGKGFEKRQVVVGEAGEPATIHGLQHADHALIGA